LGLGWSGFQSTQEHFLTECHFFNSLALAVDCDRLVLGSFVQSNPNGVIPFKAHSFFKQASLLALTSLGRRKVTVGF
jgi:hypothetical protein